MSYGDSLVLLRTKLEQEGKAELVGQIEKAMLTGSTGTEVMLLAYGIVQAILVEEHDLSEEAKAHAHHVIAAVKKTMGWS